MKTEAERRAIKRDKIMRAEYVIQDIRRKDFSSLWGIGACALIPLSSIMANTLIG